MRRIWIGFGFVMVAAVGVGLSTSRTVGQPAGGGGDTNHKKITVTGIGTVTVKSDTARVSFAVRASGMDFKTAVAECDKKAAAVKKAIDELKLGGIEIKSGPINVINASGGGFGPGGPFPLPGGGPGVPPRPVVPPLPEGPGAAAGGAGAAPSAVAVAPPAPPAQAQPAPPPVVGAPQPAPIGPPGIQPFPGGPPGFGGFAEVSRTFTVVATFGAPGAAGEPKDIVPVADKILTAAVTAGATEPPVFNNSTNPYGFGGGVVGHGGNTRIEFYRANVAQVRQEALKAAVADAVANAKAAAGVANLTAKDIVALTDQSQFGGPLGMGSGMPSATGRGEVLGEMELTVHVSVTFSY